MNNKDTENAWVYTVKVGTSEQIWALWAAFYNKQLKT